MAKVKLDSNDPKVSHSTTSTPALEAHLKERTIALSEAYEARNFAEAIRIQDDMIRVSHDLNNRVGGPQPFRG
jgi:hypothetical protein